MSKVGMPKSRAVKSGSSGKVTVGNCNLRSAQSAHNLPMAGRVKLGALRARSGILRYAAQSKPGIDGSCRSGKENESGRPNRLKAGKSGSAGNATSGNSSARRGKLITSFSHAGKLRLGKFTSRSGRPSKTFQSTPLSSGNFNAGNENFKSSNNDGNSNFIAASDGNLNSNRSKSGIGIVGRPISFRSRPTLGSSKLKLKSWLILNRSKIPNLALTCKPIRLES